MSDAKKLEEIYEELGRIGSESNDLANALEAQATRIFELVAQAADLPPLHSDEAQKAEDIKVFRMTADFRLPQEGGQRRALRQVGGAIMSEYLDKLMASRLAAEWEMYDDGDYDHCFILEANGERYESGHCDDCGGQLIRVDIDADWAGEERGYVDASFRECVKCGSGDCTSESVSTREAFVRLVAETVFPESFGPKGPGDCDCVVCDESEAA